MKTTDPQVLLERVNNGVPLNTYEIHRLINAAGVKIARQSLCRIASRAEKKFVEAMEAMRDDLDVDDVRGPVVRKRRRVT